MDTFIKESRFIRCDNINNEELIFNYLEFLKESKLNITLFNDLPEDLNNFYKIIGDGSYKCINNHITFTNYDNIKEQLDNEYIIIATIYQGMGYYVNLNYNMNYNIYYFTVNGGSDYISQQNTQKNNNINILLQNINYQFSSFSDAFQFILQNRTNYADDMEFMNNDRVINLY